MTEPSDQQLAPARWTAWYTAHARPLKAFLVTVLRDADGAEEVLQRTFAIALSKGGDVAEGSEQAWLFQVAYREALGYRRQQAVDQRARVVWGENHSRQRADQAADAGVELIQWEEVQQVRQALEQLNPEQREIVRRRIYGEQTFQEIADELGIPLGTVLTRMRLALQRLRGILKPAS